MESFNLTREFRNLYTRYYPYVFSLLFNNVRNKEDAEDICHEVFIKLLKNIGAVANHRKWLLQAMKFEITNYYNRKATGKINAEDIDTILDSTSVAYENGFRDSRIIIKDAIENDENYANEEERILFDLVALYHFSFREAGKYLNMTKDKARYTYRNIENRILIYLKQKGIMEIEDIL